MARAQNLPFSDMALGANHVLAVNKRGELYGWGKNSRGQLGLAYSTRAELKPVLVASGSHADVVRVATGGYAYEYQVRTSSPPHPEVETIRSATNRACRGRRPTHWGKVAKPFFVRETRKIYVTRAFSCF